MIGMEKYYLSSNGETLGLYSKNDILLLFKSGRIDENAYVYIGEEWVLLKDTDWLNGNAQLKLNPVAPMVTPVTVTPVTVTPVTVTPVTATPVTVTPVTVTPVTATPVTVTPVTATAAAEQEDDFFSREEKNFPEIILPPDDPNEKHVMCPHCWQEFGSSRTLYISQHPELMGDAMLGADEQSRFLPTAFNEQGYAIDAKGMVCRDMACPYCHLRIPEAIMDMPSSFISIAGAPGCGKSYFLTAMTWQLRSVLAEKFDYTLADTDPVFNAVLNRYESTIFLNSRGGSYVALPKTELNGSDYSHQISRNGMTVNLPLPFIFTLMPTPVNNRYADAGAGMSNIILYDNAGEHFEPGRDSVGNMVSRHLVHSDSIFFLYDPLEDARMQPFCDRNDPQISIMHRSTNQMVLLNEMIGRIKRLKGLHANVKYDKPLVLVVPKYDAWKTMFPLDLENTPYFSYSKKEMQHFLDVGAILNVSYCMRSQMQRFAPDVVSTCEAFFETVYYIPVSSLGRSMEIITADRKLMGIKPEDIKPLWVEVPLLLQMWLSGMIDGVAKHVRDAVPVTEYRFVQNSLIFSLPDSPQRRNVPITYCGCTVYDAESGKYITLPMAENQQAAEMAEAKNSASQAADDDFWTS